MARGLLVLLLFVSPFASAAPTDTGARWREQLAGSGDALKAKQFTKALRIVERVLADMHARLGPGDPAKEILGIAVTHKALALAGTGKKEEALWWWHIVVSMYPAFAQSDLSAFGEAGAFLAANRELPKIDHLPNFEDPPIDLPGVTAPRPRIWNRKPEFPRGVAWFGIEETLVIHAVIRRDGTLTWPRVIKGASAPTLIYATAEALRTWKFTPAKQDGVPVDSVFELVANYRLR